MSTEPTALASFPALQAAAEAMQTSWTTPEDDDTAAHTALGAAHDPALGLDRSICLRDVVEALRERAEAMDVEPRIPPVRVAVRSTYEAADFLEQTFGGQDG